MLISGRASLIYHNKLDYSDLRENNISPKKSCGLEVLSDVVAENLLKRKYLSQHIMPQCCSKSHGWRPLGFSPSATENWCNRNTRASDLHSLKPLRKPQQLTVGQPLENWKILEPVLFGKIQVSLVRGVSTPLQSQLPSAATRRCSFDNGDTSLGLTAADCSNLAWFYDIAGSPWTHVFLQLGLRISHVV